MVFLAVQSEALNFFAQIWNHRTEGLPIEKVANDEFFKSLTVLQVHPQLKSAQSRLNC